MPAMPTYTGDMPAASSSGSGGYTAGMIPVPMGSQAVSTMELKCVSDIEAACTLRFRMGVGTGGSENHRMSSLVRHDFSTKPICGLNEEEDFDFNKVVDEESQTFVVSVEVLASAQS